MSKNEILTEDKSNDNSVNLPKNSRTYSAIISCGEDLEEALTAAYSSEYISPVSDPHKGPLDLTSELIPAYVDLMLSDAEYASRLLLCDYSDSEIRKIVSDFYIAIGYERVSEEPIDSDLHLNELVDCDDELGPPIVPPPYYEFCSPLGGALTYRLLELHSAGAEPQSITMVPGADWPIIFSAFAREMLEETVQRQKAMFEPSHSNSYLTELGYVYFATYGHIGDINKCVTTALTLTTGQDKYKNFAEDLSKQRSKQARSGGLAKSDKYLPLKKEVIRLYLDSYTSKSNRHAARLIEKNIDKALLVDEVGRRIIEEPTDRFADWIGKYRNGKLNI